MRINSIPVIEYIVLQGNAVLALKEAWLGTSTEQLTINELVPVVDELVPVVDELNPVPRNSGKPGGAINILYLSFWLSLPVSQRLLTKSIVA